MNRLLLPPPPTSKILVPVYQHLHRPSKALDALLCSRTCCVPHTPHTGDDEALLTSEPPQQTHRSTLEGRQCPDFFSTTNLQFHTSPDTNTPRSPPFISEEFQFDLPHLKYTCRKKPSRLQIFVHSGLCSYLYESAPAAPPNI